MDRPPIARLDGCTLVPAPYKPSPRIRAITLAELQASGALDGDR